MFLGIEIGATKLQLGVGAADGRLAALKRADVCPANGAEGICRQIETIAGALIDKHSASAVGFGFGGPVDITEGRAVRSHQIDGWDLFPLVDWCQERLGLPAAIANDSDMAGLAEARFGAGRGGKVVFYTNIGSGIGGALIIDRRVYLGGTGIASELGHLRPELQADSRERTVESLSSGWAIAEAARTDARLAAELAQHHNCSTGQVTGRMVAEAAGAGSETARAIFARAVHYYGWAIAQMITLLAPQAVVVGGGVSLAGEDLFLAPLRQAVDRHVFPPLRGSYQVVHAALGEEVVVHGAIALARAKAEDGNTNSLFIP
jgi:glucokinase